MDPGGGSARAGRQPVARKRPGARQVAAVQPGHAGDAGSARWQARQHRAAGGLINVAAFVGLTRLIAQGIRFAVGGA